ncbi:mevalonate kinase, partial [Elysia marginata]
AAIAGSLDLRFHLKLTSTNDFKVALALPDIGISKKIELAALQSKVKKLINQESLKEPVQASEDVLSALKELLHVDADSTDTKQLAVVAFLYVYSCIFINKSEPPSISVEMKSDIPVGAGLGSSAAFSVSLSSALLQLAGVISSEKVSDNLAAWSSADLDIINKYAFLGEKMIHGTPSGIDNSISTYGGALRFQKGKMTHLDSIPTLSMMLVNTQVPRSSKTQISNFRQRYTTYTEIFEPVLSSVEAITEKAELNLKSLKETGKSIHHKTLGELMDMNHQFLNLMGVGHPTLDQVVAEAQNHGFHGKLTGAGGGGCAIILLPPEGEAAAVEKLEEKLKSLGFQVFPKTSFGGRGVMQHL